MSDEENERERKRNEPLWALVKLITHYKFLGWYIAFVLTLIFGAILLMGD